MLSEIIKLLRVKHYLKNGLVFLPLLFSGQLLSNSSGGGCSLLVIALIGTVAFSLIASVVYIVNDLNDIEQDRLHPKKRNRPLASGAISPTVAIGIAIVLLAVAIGLNFWLENKWLSITVLISYLILNLGYSFGLKNIPLIDMSILVSGFVLRVIYGGFVTDIVVSNWMYLTIIALSFYLGLGKRRNELLTQGKKLADAQTSTNGAQNTTRKVLQYYSRDFLDKNMYVCLTMSVVFYSLWTVDPGTILRLHTENLVWTVPFILLVLMRYSMIVEGESDGDPVEVIMADKALLSMCVALLLLFAGILYS